MPDLLLYLAHCRFVSKTAAFTPRSIVLPSLASGLVWAIANACFFVGQSVSAQARARV